MKYHFLIIGIALYALTVAGCSKEADDTPIPVGRQVVMNMQTDTDGVQTRANYTDNGTNMSFSWHSGDKLSVVISGVPGNENCWFSSVQEGRNASFNGNVTTFVGTKNIYAFYPFSPTPYTIARSDTPAAATVALTLPITQQYTVGGPISNSFIVGVGTATASATDKIDASAGLKQVMSIIKVNIANAPGKVTGLKLRCTEALFPTMATVKLSDACISSVGNLVNELSMTITDGTNGTDKTVSLAMFPTDLTGKEITIEVNFEKGKTKSIKKVGTNFERNMHYVMAFDGKPEPPTPVGDVVLFAKGVTLESGWYDQNKSFVGDRQLCWACTESNMIQWWQDRYVDAGKMLPYGAPNGIIPGRENAVSRKLAIFEDFHMRNFKNRGSAILRGIPQYFTTYYPEIFSDAKPFFSEGTYASSKAFRTLKEFSEFVVTGLKEDGVVGLGLLGHATTLWGVTYNSETGLIKNIYMTDSDDRHIGKIYHGLWENLSVKEHNGSVILSTGKVIEEATILYAYPGRAKR